MRYYGIAGLVPDSAMVCFRMTPRPYRTYIDDQREDSWALENGISHASGALFKATKAPGKMLCRFASIIRQYLLMLNGKPGPHQLHVERKLQNDTPLFNYLLMAHFKKQSAIHDLDNEATIFI